MDSLIVTSSGDSFVVDAGQINTPRSIEFSDGYVWYGSLSGVRWYSNRNKRKPHLCYAEGKVRAGGYRRTLLLHRVLTNASSSQVVDHIDGNTLDNRLSNLRIVTNVENLFHCHRRDRHKFTGVTLNGSGWQARATINYRRYNIGTFATREEASLARAAFLSEIKT